MAISLPMLIGGWISAYLLTWALSALGRKTRLTPRFATSVVAGGFIVMVLTVVLRAFGDADGGAPQWGASIIFAAITVPLGAAIYYIIARRKHDSAEQR